jgi:hypothetical protein
MDRVFQLLIRISPHFSLKMLLLALQELEARPIRGPGNSPPQIRRGMSQDNFTV